MTNITIKEHNKIISGKASRKEILSTIRKIGIPDYWRKASQFLSEIEEGKCKS